MARKKNEITRRDLLKLSAGAGAMTFMGGDLLSRLAHAQAGTDAPMPQVPRKVLGKTGKKIPILVAGAAMKLDPKFDPKLSEAMRFGVNYIDAADCYGGGTCEAAVGNWLKQATTREKVWITSKSDQHDPEGFEKTLNAGLRRMNTDYFDMYFLHALQEARYVSKDLSRVVERLKKEGRFLHFGFSCHDGNVDELLHVAAETPWVDCVMFRYDFTKYGDKALNKAIDACAKANVGLIAMKTQRSAMSFQDKWEKLKVGKWTKHQAVLKAVWADERLTAAISHMDTFEKLKQNIAAALDDVELGAAEWDQLNRYAAETRASSCDGCDHICNPAVNAPVQIGTTLRFLMYHDTYGEQSKAKGLFRKLPREAQHLSGVDFSGANAVCPHGVDVAAHMKRAAQVFQA